MDEVKRLRNYPLIQPPGPTNGYEPLLANLGRVTPHERPDGYLAAGDTVYIVEHFEFDSSDASRKGSVSRKELTRTKRGFEAYPVGSPAPFQDELDIAPSIGCYLENASANLRNHYGKLDDYKKRLREHGVINDDTTVRCGFFIEDVTVLGNYYVDDRGQQPLRLTDCQQFLDLFEECAGLDFCLCASRHTRPGDILDLFRTGGGTGTMRPELHFLCREALPGYRACQKDATALRFMNFDTKMHGIKGSIPF